MPGNFGIGSGKVDLGSYVHPTGAAPGLKTTIDAFTGNWADLGTDVLASNPNTSRAMGAYQSGQNLYNRFSSHDNSLKLNQDPAPYQDQQNLDDSSLTPMDKQLAINRKYGSYQNNL